MGSTTKISWCDATFNPWVGCTKVSAGCANCYAERDMDIRRGFAKWGRGKPRRRTSQANWRQPIKWDQEAAAAGVRRRVFCASLADVFDEELNDDWRVDLFHDIITETPHLDWLLLTKRPGVAWRFMSGIALAYPERAWPLPNVWLGVSVENQATADERIPILLQIPAAVRWVSYEPAIGPVDFECFPSTGCPTEWLDKRPGIDWIVVGGESGPKARSFDVAWAHSTIAQCRTAGVSCFVKQLGSKPMAIEGSDAAKRWEPNGRDGIGFMDDCAGVHLHDSKGADPAEWPEDLRLAEWPK